MALLAFPVTVNEPLPLMIKLLSAYNAPFTVEELSSANSFVVPSASVTVTFLAEVTTNGASVFLMVAFLKTT